MSNLKQPLFFTIIVIILSLTLTAVYAGGVDPELTTTPVATTPVAQLTPTGPWPNANPSGPWTPTAIVAAPTKIVPSQLTPTTTSTNPNADAPTNLVAYFPFDQTSGRFVDEISNWQGSINGTHWNIPAAVENGLVLSNAQAAIGDNPALSPEGNDFTIAWWVWLDEGSAGVDLGTPQANAHFVDSKDALIIEKATYTTAQTCHFGECFLERFFIGGYRFAILPGFFELLIAGEREFGSRFIEINVRLANQLETRQWHHIALTVRRDQATQLYLNGSLIQTDVALSSEAIIQYDVPLQIRTRTTDGIDDLRFYNRALNSAEIRTLYNLGQ